MKNKLLRIFAAGAVLTSLNVKAQKNFAPANPRVLSLEKSSQNESFSFPEIENFDGSYQFEVKKKENFLFTSETFQLIEKSRHETEDITIPLNQYLDVFIYSKQKVNSKMFVPFKTTYIFK